MVFLKVRFQDRVCIEILHLKLLAMTLAKGISAENVPTRLGSHLATDFKENTLFLQLEDKKTFWNKMVRKLTSNGAAPCYSAPHHCHSFSLIRTAVSSSVSSQLCPSPPRSIMTNC
ncbi:MAG: Uncharacterised protein [Gammaproteobacteria bacterium]|nr:MAG: Uncharacterised protein [Gammaproteobacteria bacterium]